MPLGGDGQAALTANHPSSQLQRDDISSAVLSLLRLHFTQITRQTVKGGKMDSLRSPAFMKRDTYGSVTIYSIRLKGCWWPTVCVHKCNIHTGASVTSQPV